MPSEGANHKERAGEEAVETEGRWLGDGIRFRLNGGQVGTGCLYSRGNGCLSKVEHRCRLALNGTELALSFNFFFHQHGSQKCIKNMLQALLHWVCLDHTSCFLLGTADSLWSSHHQTSILATSQFFCAESHCKFEGLSFRTLSLFFSPYLPRPIIHFTV